jgi:hypothetical protein
MGFEVYSLRAGSMKVETRDKFSQESLFNSLLNKTQSFGQGFSYYDSYRVGGQQSGAYIFRPQTQQSTPLQLLRTTQVNGPLVREIRRDFGDVKQVMRIFSGPDAQYLEVDVDAGVIPRDKELVMKVQSSIKNQRTIYTDDNALESLERVHRTNRIEYVSSNYYPVQYSAFIKDGENQLSIVMNHTVGAASMNEGEIEVMIHRRTSMDDARGVDEPVNDTSILRTTIRVIVSPVGEASKHRHTSSYHLNFPMEVYCTETNFQRPFRPRFTPMLKDLPLNIHLLNLETLNPQKKEVLLRFIHIYEKGDDEMLSKPVQFDIRDYIRYRIQDITKTSLSTLESCKLTILTSSWTFKWHRNLKTNGD